MPGFDKVRFVDVSDQDLDEFSCGICYEVFNNPVFSPCCRQTYCSDCINQWLTQHNTCPNDRQALKADDLSTPPRVLINILNKLKIKCDYQQNGCQTVVRLNELSNHTEICSFNANRKCENCGLIVGSDHNCILNLKLTNDCINEQIFRLTNENSDLRQKIERLERNPIASTSSFPIQGNRDDKTLKVVNSGMSEEMKVFAISVANEAHDRFRNEIEGKLSTHMKSEFEKKYHTKWNCVVSTGVNWGIGYYAENHYIYFKIGLFHFVIWESPK